ncbi:hypothetical protein Pmar_PMAR027976, partial [Perkinsus marinus ATCC 50983]
APHRYSDFSTVSQCDTSRDRWLGRLDAASPSPDEAALVKYARECGIKLIRETMIV